MSAEAGTVVLVQIGQGDGSPETFVNLEGQQEAELNFNPVTADISTKLNQGFGGQIVTLNNVTVTCSGVNDNVGPQLLKCLHAMQTRTSLTVRFVYDAAGSHYEGTFYVTGGPGIAGGVTTATTYNFEFSNDGVVNRVDHN